MYEIVRNKILTLEFQPGMIITEKFICETSSASRTPVRDALKRLLHDGWLERANNKSFCVNSLRMNKVKEIFLVREMMETFAFDLIFEKGLSRLLAGKMDIALQEMLINNGNVVDFINKDFAFHANTFYALDNSLLISMWNKIGEEMIRIGVMNMRGENRFEEVIQEHSNIIDALWNKDKDKTKQKLLEHLTKSRKNIKCDN